MLVIQKGIEKFPPRSSTSTRVLLSRVVKTSGYGSVVQEELSGDLFSWNREVTESSEVREVAHRVQACVARDHEVIIATFAEELKANSEGFPTSRHGEGAEHLQCHRTPKISSSSSTLIMNRLTRSNRQC